VKAKSELSSRRTSR